MTEFKCDTRSHKTLYTERNNLCLLFYTDCTIVVRHLLYTQYPLKIIPTKPGEEA